MTIFDIVNDICNRKTHKMDNDVTWDDNSTSPYMLQRWTSMTSPINAYLINELANRSGVCTTVDEKLCYHLLSAIAQPNRKRVKYYKRAKPVKEQPNKELDAEALRLGISPADRLRYDKMLKVMSSASIKR